MVIITSFYGVFRICWVMVLSAFRSAHVTLVITSETGTVNIPIFTDEEAGVK